MFPSPGGSGLCIGVIRIATVPSQGVASRCGQHHRGPSESCAAMTLAEKVRQLQGPILVLGGSGFIGGNIARTLLAHRDDVYATATRLPAWRLEGLSQKNVKVSDLLIDSNLDALLDSVQPRTVIDCVAYGAYSFETDS